MAATTAGFWDAGALALAGGGAAAPLAAAALPVPGSGDMMLTAGVEAGDGNSALVGFPVGADGGYAASARIAGFADGVFQIAAYRLTSPS